MSSIEERLYAYHDGELSGLARWRFERALRRSPELRAEVDRLATLRDLLRARDADEPAPDLWASVSLRLPGADARRQEEASGAAAAGLGWWLKPVGAAAATVAVALLAVYEGFWQETPVAASGQVVRWIDSGERSVMVLDDEPDTTIIWVLDGLPEGAWIGGRRDEA